MANISNVLSGLGAVAGGIAGGYEDPSMGLKMFLAQRKSEDEQVYRQMRLKATLFSKGFEEVTDEDELKTLVKNRMVNPAANKSYLDLGGSAFYKISPTAKKKGNTSAVNDMISKAQEFTQYRQAVQNAIKQGAPLEEIKTGISKGGYKLADFSDLVVPYAGGLNKMPTPPNMKQLFMQNVGNMFMGAITPKDNFKKVMTK